MERMMIAVATRESVQSSARPIYSNNKRAIKLEYEQDDSVVNWAQKSRPLGAYDTRSVVTSHS